MMRTLEANSNSSEEANPAGGTLRGFGSITVPEHSLGDWGMSAVLFAGSCLYLRLFYNYTTMFPDEGIVLQGAQRILHGQVLYRDFFSLVTPGSFYWTALLFRVFGDSILVARFALVVYGAIFAVLTYLIARRVCSRGLSSLVAYLGTITCLPYYFMALHSWDSTLCAYLALYAAVRSLESRHWAWPALTGTFAAFTCLVEQSTGAGLVLGMGLGFLLIAACGRYPLLASRRQLISLMGGFIWPAASTFAYFGTRHTLWQMVEGCLWPLHHYSLINKAFYADGGLRISDLHTLLSGSRPLGLIGLLALVPYFVIPALPVLAVGFILLGCGLLLRRQGPEDTARYYVLVSSILFGLLFSTLVTGRPDMIHIMFHAPLFMLVLAWGLGGRGLRSQLLQRVGPIIWFVVGASFTTFGLALLSPSLNAHFRLGTRRGILRAAGPDGVIAELQARVHAGGNVFIYPYQPLDYYLAGVTNPTRYEFLVPGYTTHEQFEEVIAQVDADRTPVILFQPSFLGDIPFNTSKMPVGVLAARDIVAEYISVHYRSCKVLNSLRPSLLFMVRKDLNCAGPF